MVVVVPPPATLSPEILSLFYATDERLGGSRVLIFHGPSATATSSGSRIQIHIFSCAGFQSYPRLTISPSSPLYAAVERLPREDQGDEICRGLAFSIYKYFTELPENVKDAWATSVAKSSVHSDLFEESHAAELASRMAKVEDVRNVIVDIERALGAQSVPWLDLDVVLPPGSIRTLEKPDRDSTDIEISEDDLTRLRYGEYTALVKSLGSAAFLASTKLRRAPSKPTAVNRTMSFSRKQKEGIRREMCEFLDTEESYVGKIYDLVHSVAADFRQKAKAKGAGSSSPGERALQGLFPPSLDRILELNNRFLEEIRVIIEETENEAIKDIESTLDGEIPLTAPAKHGRTDVTGALALAQCLLSSVPGFADCYADYIQAHSGFSQLLKVFMRETGSSFSKRIQETGEQRLTSMLIEPVQRLPRYNLYIDNIVKQLPVRHPAIKPLLKARDIISDICAQDSAPGEHAKIMHHLQRLLPTWPQHFRPQGRLIQALDVVELEAPFTDDHKSDKSGSGTLLLFADCLVLLRKTESGATSARGLLAVLNKQGVGDADRLQENLITETTRFGQAISVSDCTVTEMDYGKAVRLIASSTKSCLVGKDHRVKPVLDLLLAGSYEKKAARLIEEISKARVENRFPESEREGKWELRMMPGDLGLIAAIFERKKDEQESVPGAQPLVRIVVDSAKGPRSTASVTEKVEVVGHLTTIGEGYYLLEVNGPTDYATRDRVTVSELLPVLKKRRKYICSAQDSIRVC